MRIQLTKKAFEEARAYSNRIAKLDLMNKPNYTGINQEDRYFIGYLGEWAFAQFLVIREVGFHWHTNTSGKSDNCDFTIKGKKIDIKTCSKLGKPEYKHLMMPSKQFFHIRDYYIAVGINEKEGYAEVQGYTTRNRLEGIEPKDFGYGPTIALELTELINIETFIKSIKQEIVWADKV